MIAFETGLLGNAAEEEDEEVDESSEETLWEMCAAIIIEDQRKA